MSRKIKASMRKNGMKRKLKRSRSRRCFSEQEGFKMMRQEEEGKGAEIFKLTKLLKPLEIGLVSRCRLQQTAGPGCLIISRDAAKISRDSFDRLKLTK